MDTVTVSIPEGSEQINLVDEASLEAGVTYYAENTGLGRLGLAESAEAPDRTDVVGHVLVPRGIMSIRTIQYDGIRGIWVWPTEFLPSQVTISAVPV